MQRPISVAVLITTLAIGLLSVSAAAGRCEDWAARVVSVQGSVEIKARHTAVWRHADVNDPLCFGDSLRIGTRSRASIELHNDTILRLDQNSFLSLPEPRDSMLSLVKLLRGALHLISRTTRRLEVQTPFVSAGLEGTEFVVDIDDEATVVAVIEGEVTLRNATGTLQLAGGQTAAAASGQAPVLRLDLAPEDAVRWAIHYPSIGDPSVFPAGSAIVEAQALLQAGRVDAAGAAIDAALAANPADADALALSAVIQLARNQKQAALATARQAVASDPSATALTALSFAQQADFDLDAARATIERAIRDSPEQALLWARLAEVQTAQGASTAAIASAGRAVELDPRLARTQTVLGFAHLNRLNTPAARAAFARAIALDSADPLPRVGLGLLKIRDGDTAGGRREMEIALSLDPANALIRSYLGKAYISEGRIEPGATELALAKQLDPLDPTPWLYSAVLNSMQGDPIRAFTDLQASIARNDYRAVYRARLQLDQDLAVRSAALGRIYGALGLESRGLLEGWLSTTSEPGNFAAHQLLADSYAPLPRHETAALSERLQAQLLRPGGLSPEPPQVSQNRLGIDGTLYQDALSHRELGTLYETGGGGVRGSLLVGGSGTEGVDVAGVLNHGRFALGFGHFGYQTDGFHTNGAQRQDISNLVLKGALTADTSLLFEARSRDLDEGQPHRFFDAAIDPFRTESNRVRQLRIGGRHDFGPSNTLIASVTRHDEEPRTLFFGLPLVASDVEETSVELRDIWLLPFGSMDFGIAHTETDAVTTELFAGDEKRDTSHSTAYWYGNLRLADDVEAVLGASADLFDFDSAAGGQSTGFERRPINPKLGLLWRPDAALTLRAALTQSMTRIVKHAQTLEPTHVAGFNQIYDDPPGTLSRKAGLGVDYRAGDRLFAGAQAWHRELEIPVSVFGEISDFDSEEEGARVFLGKILSSRLVGSVEYRYEKIERDNDGARTIDGFERATTHRVPLSLRLFPGHGLSAMLRTTFVDQSGVFQSTVSKDGPYVPGSDSFWVTDVSLSKRLPGAHGAMTVGVENLFDEEFRFQDTDASRSSFVPQRRAFVQLNLAF